jgi:hypothetical protein
VLQVGLTMAWLLPICFCHLQGVLGFLTHILKLVFLLIYRGRRITSNGQRDLDQVAGRITVAAV